MRLKHQLIWVLTIPLLAPPLYASAGGESLVEMTTTPGNVVIISSPYQRVGNSVMVRVNSYTPSNKFSFSQVQLVACNGTWMSSSIQFAAQFDLAIAFTDIEKYAKENDDPLPLSAVTFEDNGEAKIFYAAALLKRAPQLCKTAAREPRNDLIPIAQTAEIDGAGRSIALMLGTSVRAGSVVDVWTRSTWYKQAPILDKQGVPISYAGKVQQRKVPTGKYSLDRTAYDCRSREMGVYHSSLYEGIGVVPATTSLAREKLRLAPVIPNSVGEAELDAICKVYGT